MRQIAGSVLIAACLTVAGVVAIACGGDAAPDSTPDSPSEPSEPGTSSTQPDATDLTSPPDTASTASTGPEPIVPTASDMIDPEVYPNVTNIFVDFVTEEKGTFTALLYDDLVPSIVDNFVALAEDGFYDGLTFHRVVENFVIQGGDPNGDGTGGPGHTVNDEFHPAALHDSAGVLSMANSGYNTNGSQFFVTLDATPHLDAYDAVGNLKNCPEQNVSCHAVFGRVITGLEETVNAISVGDVINEVRIRRTNGLPIPSVTGDGQELATLNSAIDEDSDKTYYASFETTHGNFRVQLHHEEVPDLVVYFVTLAQKGYYNGAPLARFAATEDTPEEIRGGNNLTSGLQIPVYLGNTGVTPFLVANEYHPDLRHDRAGRVSLLPIGLDESGDMTRVISTGSFRISIGEDVGIDAYDADGELREDCVREVPCFALFGTVVEGLSVVTGLDLFALITRVVIQETV